MTYAHLQDAGKLLVNKFRDLRKLSTLNHYATCVSTMVKFVMGLKEFKLTITEKHFETDPPIISIDDFF